VPANEIVGLGPGELFVHRNIANLAPPLDANVQSVLQYAVAALRVKHIIVCGHYGCGGVQAAMETQRHGLIDNWLRHIRDTVNLHSELLDSIAGEDEKLDKLCELNVAEQVLNVAETTIVLDAWNRSQNLTIHGWIYSLKGGLIRDLGISIKSEAGLSNLRNDFLFHEKRRGAGEASK